MLYGKIRIKPYVGKDLKHRRLVWEVLLCPKEDNLKSDAYISTLTNNWAYLTENSARVAAKEWISRLDVGVEFVDELPEDNAVYIGCPCCGAMER